MHRHYYINVLEIMYLYIVYFAYAISKKSTSFKYSFFVSTVWVAAVPVFEMVIVPLLRCTYLSIQSHEIDFSTEFSHWLWLYNLTCESSSSST